MTKLKEYTVVLVMNEADIVRSLPKEYYLVLLKCLLLRNFLYSGNAHKLEATNTNCLRNIMHRV